MRNLALAILNIFSYLVKPLFITNFSLPPSFQTSCRCFDNSISSGTICTGCSHCILLHCGGFAHLTGALIPTLDCISHTPMPPHTDGSLIHAGSPSVCHLRHSAQDPIPCSILTQFLPNFSIHYLCQHKSLPPPTPAKLEDWIILEDHQGGRGSLWFIKELSVFLEVTVSVVFFAGINNIKSGVFHPLFFFLICWAVSALLCEMPKMT